MRIRFTWPLILDTRLILNDFFVQSWVYGFHLPSRELTYPPKNGILKMIFQTSQGGICIHSLEGTLNYDVCLTWVQPPVPAGWWSHTPRILNKNQLLGLFHNRWLGKWGKTQGMDLTQKKLRWLAGKSTFEGSGSLGWDPFLGDQTMENLPWMKIYILLKKSKFSNVILVKSKRPKTRVLEQGSWERGSPPNFREI